MSDTKDEVETLPPAPSPTTKAINKLIYLALGFIGLALLVFGYWAIPTQEPLTLNNDPFPTRSIREHAQAAGVIILITDYCKNIQARGETRISFVSSTKEVFLPLSTENSSPGCYKREVPVLLPKDLEPGEYRVKFKITYDINPIRQDVPVEFESQPFIVDPTNKDGSISTPQ